MPIVSFICFGKHQHRSASKSSILNDIINITYFFVVTILVDNNYNRILGEGLVDMCWYFPTGEPKEPFPDTVTFMVMPNSILYRPDSSAKYLPCALSLLQTRN